MIPNHRSRSSKIEEAIRYHMANGMSQVDAYNCVMGKDKKTTWLQRVIKSLWRELKQVSVSTRRFIMVHWAERVQ